MHRPWAPVAWVPSGHWEESAGRRGFAGFGKDKGIIACETGLQGLCYWAGTLKRAFWLLPVGWVSTFVTVVLLCFVLLLNDSNQSSPPALRLLGSSFTSSQATSAPLGSSPPSSQPGQMAQSVTAPGKLLQGDGEGWEEAERYQPFAQGTALWRELYSIIQFSFLSSPFLWEWCW